jgi:hypothetical protein
MRHKLQLLVLLLEIFLMTAATVGATDLRGGVAGLDRDSQPPTPLAGVGVALFAVMPNGAFNLVRQTVTGPDGKYYFNGVRAGHYILQIGGINYPLEVGATEMQDIPIIAPPRKPGSDAQIESLRKSDAQIESLRNFELAFIDQFAVPGKRFNAAAFDAKVNEGNAKFQQAIAGPIFTARRPVLVDLKAQFDADAAHLRSKASRGKITPTLASEMKKDVNKIYDVAQGR